MYYWTAQYASKYVAREFYVVFIRASKMVEFKSGDFRPYNTSTVLYGTVLYCTLRYCTVRYGTFILTVPYGTVLYHSVGATRTMNQSIYGTMKIHLRSGIVPDFGSSHTHPTEFGLNSLAGASSNPVFLKDQRNLRSFGSSEQWFCTSPAKSCPIWTRYAKDYLSSVRARSGLIGRFWP